MSLHNALRRNVQWKPKQGTYGIEIECETKTVENYPMGFFTNAREHQSRPITVYDTPMVDWEANTDGSLRDFGMEFILKEPLFYLDAIAALDDFGVKTKDVKFLQGTPSTSVHIHVNMAEEKLLTLANFITAYALYENLLLEYSGEGRRSNLFALGIRSAEGSLGNIIKMLTGANEGKYQALVHSESYVKYAALNIATLARFGSIEIRCFRGTTDVREIQEWLSIINKLFLFAKTPGLTPKRMLLEFNAKGDELMTDIFGEYAEKLQCLDYKSMIDRNLYYAYKMTTCVDNWETFGLEFDKIPEPKPRKKNVEGGLSYGMVLETSPYPFDLPPQGTKSYYNVDAGQYELKITSVSKYTYYMQLQEAQAAIEQINTSVFTIPTTMNFQPWATVTPTPAIVDDIEDGDF
jgi:hypothetical protein